MSEVKTYRIEEIMNMLPHRYPFLLVDRLEVEVPGEKGVGIKNVTINIGVPTKVTAGGSGYARRSAD